ncbi:MAG: SnoaL-like domain-containing protein [Flavobacteriales bacterium]
MTTKQVADRLVELCRQGKNIEAVKELYATDVVSHEPAGYPNGPERIAGKAAVLAKAEGFQANLETMHSAYVSDPLVAANHFTVTMGMDVTLKGAGRMQLDEVAVYEVTDGQITREQFFFPTQA